MRSSVCFLVSDNGIVFRRYFIFHLIVRQNIFLAQFCAYFVIKFAAKNEIRLTMKKVLLKNNFEYGFSVVNNNGGGYFPAKFQNS